MANINDRLLFNPAPPIREVAPASGLVFPRSGGDEEAVNESLLVETTRATGLKTKQVNDYSLTINDSLTVQVS